MEIAGKVAVITGGGSGIGRGVGTLFAERGMRVVLADMNAEVLDATVADLRGQGSRRDGRTDRRGRLRRGQATRRCRLRRLRQRARPHEQRGHGWRRHVRRRRHGAVAARHRREHRRHVARDPRVHAAHDRQRRRGLHHGHDVGVGRTGNHVQRRAVRGDEDGRPQPDGVALRLSAATEGRRSTPRACSLRSLARAWAARSSSTC